MIRVSEIVSKAHIAMNDFGYIAVYGSYYAEGGTRREALTNLLDEINAERGYRDLRRRMKKRVFWNSISMN